MQKDVIGYATTVLRHGEFAFMTLQSREPTAWRDTIQWHKPYVERVARKRLRFFWIMPNVYLRTSSNTKKALDIGQRLRVTLARLLSTVPRSASMFICNMVVWQLLWAWRSIPKGHRHLCDKYYLKCWSIENLPGFLYDAACLYARPVTTSDQESVLIKARNRLITNTNTDALLLNS